MARKTLLRHASCPASNFSKTLKGACFFTQFSCSFLSVLLISNLLLTGGCNSTLDKQEYVRWIRDYNNNVHVRSSGSDFIFDVQYQPAEYVLLQRGIGDLPAEARVQELKKLEGVQYYTLVLSTAEGTDLVSYRVSNESERQKREYYFSYQFQQDITLEEGGKVLPCILYHFEKPRSQQGGRTFVLGFENNVKQAGEAKLVIRSSLVSSLPVKIKIVKSDIPNVDL